MNISRIHRLLRLITILQSGQAPSVNDLAEELKISRRTLFRDLKILEAANIPYYHKHGTGYHIARHFFLPPVSLTIPEILSLMVMGKEAQTRRNRPLKQPALDAIANTLLNRTPVAIECGDQLTIRRHRPAGSLPRGAIGFLQHILLVVLKVAEERLPIGIDRLRVVLILRVEVFDIIRVCTLQK